MVSESCTSVLLLRCTADCRLKMYELFTKIKFGMSDEEYETQKELLGKEPNSYEEFVKRTGAEWKEIESTQ